MPMAKSSKDRPYTLEPYNPSWKTRFTQIKRIITPLFGDNLIVIDHVGSTAIACTDMFAKPQIDVCIAVKDIDRVPAVYPSFQALGYTTLGRAYVGDGDDYIVKDDPTTGQRLESLHIYGAGHPKPEQYRRFRDYLTTHTKERAQYVALKQELVKNKTYTQYDSGKTALIEELKVKANRWAEQKTTS